MEKKPRPNALDRQMESTCTRLAPFVGRLHKFARVFGNQIPDADYWIEGDPPGSLSGQIQLLQHLHACGMASLKDGGGWGPVMRALREFVEHYGKLDKLQTKEYDSSVIAAQRRLCVAALRKAEAAVDAWQASCG